VTDKEEPLFGPVAIAIIAVMVWLVLTVVVAAIAKVLGL
jgi:hypothetical protein